MPLVKQEAGKVKAEKDPDLARAIRLSLEENKKVKNEPIKAERTAVKAERIGVKAEPVAVKAERTAPASSSALPSLKAKVEQLRQVGAMKIKAELLKNSDKDDDADAGKFADIVARGLKMRAASQKVKKEQKRKGPGSTVRKLIKVKKERMRNADGSLRKKPRVTAKVRKARREVINREIALSNELAEVLGADALSRPEAIRRLWAYCKDNKMINPDNAREIIFDDKMESMMGQKTAQMTDMMGLLVPHLDYTKPVVKQEMKQEVKNERGGIIKQEARHCRKGHLLCARQVPNATFSCDGCGIRFNKGDKAYGCRQCDYDKCETCINGVQAKKEPGAVMKNEMKQERQAPSQVTAKRELKSEVSEGPKRAKQELASSSGQDPQLRASSKEALGSSIPQISSFNSDSAVALCLAPPGAFQFEAVASPSPATGKTIVQPCSVEFCEDRNGNLEPHAEAKFVGLDPKLSYLIKVQVRGDAEFCSREAMLPQRASPSKWSTRDVTTWCQAQHVPELVRMTQEYGIDGKALLSMGEEDLKASGLSAPVLIRRTLANLDALRAAGV